MLEGIKLLEDRKFYVYIYLDPRKFGTFIYGSHCFGFEPFYVGKGCGNRLVAHLKKKNLKTGNITKNSIIRSIIEENYTPIILKVKNNLTEKEALDYEEKLVNLIGRININTGPLTNAKPGGGSNLSGEWNPMHGRNDQCKKKGGLNDWARSNTGKTYEEIYGEERAREIKKKVGDASRGRSQTEEDKKKKSESNKKTRSENPEKYKKIASDNGKKRKGSHLSLEQRKRISECTKGREAWNKGVPVKEDTKKKISDTFLKKLIERLDVDLILDLYKQGMSIRNIAKNLHIDRGNISKVIKDPDKYRKK